MVESRAAAVEEGVGVECVEVVGEGAGDVVAEAAAAAEMVLGRRGWEPGRGERGLTSYPRRSLGPADALGLLALRVPCP